MTLYKKQTPSPQANANLALLGANSAGAQNPVATQKDLLPKDALGTVLSFVEDSIYGMPDDPQAGNITADLIQAKKGVTVLLFHQQGSAPSYGSNFIETADSSDYDTAGLNLIFVLYVDDTHIYYKVTQPK